jgi:hypothetical protein
MTWIGCLHDHALAGQVNFQHSTAWCIHVIAGRIDVDQLLSCSTSLAGQIDIDELAVAVEELAQSKATIRNLKYVIAGLVGG